MNFDFLKGLDSLGKIFNSCENAEELAISKPDLSMVSARKSAEALAKFVYMKAYSEEVTNLKFADVLYDPVVRRYLAKPVLDAFHFIRKKGNTAVHTAEEQSTDAAISVLEKLHFVVGEVAKRMGLINKYPLFDFNLVLNETAQLEDMDVDNMAQEMYEDYIVGKSRVEHLMKEFYDLCLPCRFVPGNVDLNEILEFKKKPKQKNTITYIQEYFAFLGIKSLKECFENTKKEITYSAELTIYGENGYRTTDVYSFVNGILYDLPDADGFRIVSNYSGPSFAPWFDNEIREEFYKVAEKIGENEQFVYSHFNFLYNHGEVICYKYENGKQIDLKSLYTEDIINHKSHYGWWTWGQGLYVDFDFDKYPVILEELKEIVYKYIPSDQIACCEEAWEDGDPGIIVDDIVWCPDDLEIVNRFLGEINAALNPIIAECVGGCEGLGWYQIEAPFAVANWMWSKEGFKLMGTCF